MGEYTGTAYPGTAFRLNPLASAFVPQQHSTTRLATSVIDAGRLPGIGLLDMPAEIRLLIYDCILPDHFSVTYDTVKSNSLARHLSINPRGLLLTCRLIHHELQPLLTRNITSVLFQVPHRLFDNGKGSEAWRTWQEVTICPKLLPNELGRQLRKIELRIGCRRWMCRKCVQGQLAAWKARSPRLERVLIGIDVENVDEESEILGEQSEVTSLIKVLEGDTEDPKPDGKEVAKQSALKEPVFSRWGWLNQMKTLGMTVLVEVAVLGPVKMICDGKRHKCGVRCFEKNFVVSVFLHEEGVIRC